MSEPDKNKFPVILAVLAIMVSLFLAKDSAAEQDKEFFQQSVATAGQELTAKYPWVNFEYQGEVNDWYKWLLLKSMSLYPERHVKNVQSVAIKNMSQFPVRALISFKLSGGSSKIKLNLNPIEFPLESGFACKTVLECQQVTDGNLNRSFVGVVLHELGHVTDLGPSTAGKGKTKNDAFSDGPYSFPKDDPSISFYSICFDSTSNLAPKKCARNDFVSDYAKSDVFEDFAETMNVYITDNRNFYEKAGKSPSLMKKYEFIRDKIFDGKEFSLSKGGIANLFTTYDSTVRRFDIGMLFMEYGGGNNA